MKQKLAHIGSIAARRAQKFSDRWAAAYWHDFPFGETPRAGRDQYESLWRAEKEKSYPETAAFEKTCGFALDKNWLDDLALHTQIVIKDSPLCYQHGPILYAALRRYLADNNKRDLNIVETGTARGFSAVCMARALSNSGATGRIFTFDLLPHRTPMYWNCIDDTQGPKSREALLSPWAAECASVAFIEGDSRIMLEKIALPRVDFAFLDGAHTWQDVIAEFALVAPLQSSGDITVFDDYSANAFPGLVRAVDEGCEKWGYDKTVIRSNERRAYVIAVKR